MTFSVSACRRFADFALSREAGHPLVVRPEPKGVRVARFVLPLELCPTLNAFAEMHPGIRKRIKSQALLLMRAQHDTRLPMLSGRPWAQAVRFSSRSADEQSGWSKIPVDRLTGKHGGLGLIEDDRFNRLELHCHWEPAPPGGGFVLLDVHHTEGVTP